jgi:hypothetical protein
MPDWLKALIITPIGFAFFAILGIVNVINEGRSS